MTQPYYVTYSFGETISYNGMIDIREEAQQPRKDSPSAIGESFIRRRSRAPSLGGKAAAPHRTLVIVLRSAVANFFEFTSW